MHINKLPGSKVSGVLMPGQCPLWVKSRHSINSGDVRFTPKSGHRTFASGLAALMFVDRGLDRRLRLRAGGPTLTRDQLS